MKKLFAAFVAVILVVFALCVVSSAYDSEDGGDKFEDFGIVFHVGDVVLFHGDSCYNKEYYEEYKDYDPDDGDPFELKDPVPEPYYDLPGYYISSHDTKFLAVNSDLISVVEVIPGECYAVTCRAPGTFSLYSYVTGDFTTYYTAVIEDTRSGSFIVSFLSGLTEIFAGLVKGFAGVSVNAADSLILTSDGSLTSFAQLGIFGIGLALVAGVVGLLARRFRR